jgi:hypothetical protein
MRRALAIGSARPKTRKTPEANLELARKRMKEMKQ